MEAEPTPPAAINWPPEYHTARTPVHVRNELHMPAAPEVVWAWLVRAPLWPAWYVNSANVRLLDEPALDLKLGTRFSWKTFSANVVSTVREYVPPERIAWDGKGIGLDVYHAWLIVRTASGCYVLTEETQHGVLARLQSIFMPRRMHHYHQLWLEQLAARAATGLPPADVR